MVSVLATPTTAAVASPPAVDQYTRHLPSAGGGSGAARGKPPVARPGLLPRKSLAALSGPDGQLLAQIATARDLGAPARAGAGTGPTSGNDRGLATVLANGVGTGPSLALIGGLGGIAVAGVWRRFSRRRLSSPRHARWPE
jgi:hypothetical protein